MGDFIVSGCVLDGGNGYGSCGVYHGGEIRLGSDLGRVWADGGRRMCLWMLSGLMVLMSGVIGWKMERLLIIAIDWQDSSNWWMAAKVVLGGSERVGLVCYTGLWSFGAT
ncbi:hypothetical protein HS088_TW04G01430 [Tripterygium wilfordii]|uniref:Uncharacterized protein n=1 Tax=Tripterygium wilfordii TaxID=458696 RepID=A0A7J7DT24_TRIWF|nr:hypothetical protein HS088_TW04G01430 [Tripterygium wilfordii]